MRNSFHRHAFMSLSKSDLMNMQDCLPQERVLSYSDLFFFRAMLEGLIAQGKIPDSPPLVSWRHELEAHLKLSDWLGVVDGAASDPYRLSLLWLHAAALAWFHGVRKSAYAASLLALQVRLQKLYWTRYGGSVPTGWLSMLRRYQAPVTYGFQESITIQADFSLYAATHDLLVATAYLSRPLDLKMLFASNANQILKESLEKPLASDIRMEILLVLCAVDAVSIQELGALFLVPASYLRTYLAAPTQESPDRAQREYFHTQLLAQLLLLLLSRETVR